MSVAGVLNRFRRIRRLSTLMPWTTATAVTANRSSRTVNVLLRPLGREIVMRTGTSDLACLEKVFFQKEYASPYALHPRVIVDAGANIGAATLFFTMTYPDAKIFAIEPEQSNFDLLERNCKGLNNVVCIKSAVWPNDGLLSLVDAAAEKWAFAVKPHDASSTDAVNAVSVGRLVEQYAIERIDILKLDIEGAERELFSDASAQIWLDRVGMIVIEFHDRYKLGCAQAFYAALREREFDQEIRGENVFVRLRPGGLLP